MLPVAATMLAGVALMASAPTLPGPIPAALTVALGLALCIVRRIRVFGWLLIGAGWLAVVAGAQLSNRLPPDRSGAEYLLEGRVVGIPEARPGRVRFLFEPDPGARPDRVPSRLRLNVYEADVVPAAGERWRLRVRLRPPRGLANPGAFDYERWLLARRIGATGYVRPDPRNVRLGGSGLGGRVSRLRADGARAVERVLGEGASAAVVAALTLGLRQGLDDETRRVLRVTGTAHLMAISGLHVGMVGGIGLLAGRLLWSVRWRAWPRAPAGVGRRHGSLAAGWLLALAYTVLSGAGVPARRALIMLTVACLVLAWRRRTGPWTPLAAAVLALVAMDPLAVLEAGFWLSIVAVAGLTAAARGRVALVGGARVLFGAQAAVALALVLPGLLTFGGLSVYGPLVNLLVVPLFGFAVVPLSLAGLLALAVTDRLAVVALMPAAAMVDVVLSALGRVAELPGAWLEPAAAPAWALAAAGLAAAGLLMPLPASARAALVLVMAPALFWRSEPLPSGAYQVTMLDVGQGLAGVIRTRGMTALFDAGPAWRGGGDAGASIVAPFLAAAGIRSIDALVLSHGDIDHRGGVGSVERQYRPARRWVGPDAAREGFDGVACRPGAGWHWDGIEFRFLHPPVAGSPSGNDSSCVLLVDGPGGRTLLTGDIESTGEAMLLGAGRSIAADLVVAPHHGSDTSSTPPFVAATKARWVVFPAGRDNRWGFPATAVERRWAAAGARLWTTGVDGAVQVTFLPSGPSGHPRGWRCAQRRFWRYRQCGRGPRVPGPNDSQYHSADPAPRSEGPDG